MRTLLETFLNRKNLSFFEKTTMTQIKNIAFLLTIISLTACLPMDPLIIPESNLVQKIEARISNSYNIETEKYEGNVEIKNIEKIQQVISFLENINSGMRQATTTYPTPTHTIIVTDKNNSRLLIFIGLDWIGGRNNIEGSASENRLRGLSQSEREKLLTILGIADYRF